MEAASPPSAAASAPRQWYPGDPAPHFIAAATNNPRFNFGSIAGRYVVLSFFGSAGIAKNREAVAHMTARRDWFDDERASFFGVSIDPADEAQGRVQQMIPGIRHFWDFDRAVSILYGAADAAADPAGNVVYRPFTLVLDPMLRVIATIGMGDAAQHNRAFDQVMAGLPPAAADHAGVPVHAPVLVVPRLFEPEFCRRLIGLYDAHGGSESGFMREVEGKTVGILDYTFKRRKDYTIEDPELMAAIRARLNRRLVPAIEQAFQFKATRMERYIVACYEAETGGFFRPHRDNTTKGTAHRQFAVTINLNAEEYEGGNLRFPEFGSQTYRAPTGGAVVFSCSLLHEATPVTKGRRYAFLPFLYDDAHAAVREANAGYLSGEILDHNQ